jgi:hypothetical protein
MELADRAALRAAMSRRARPIGRLHRPDGTSVVDTVADPARGYLMRGPGFGVFHVSADGRRVSCAPRQISSWRWQRYLVGRVLPFASTLAGFEPFHASAVAWQGRAIALVGESGLGKSTLAAALMLSGAQLLTDDVLAAQRLDDEVVAHPGPGLMSLRRWAVERLRVSELRSLGTRVGGDRNAIRLAVARHELPLPLGAIYVLERGTALEPEIRPLAEPDPRLLLASSFNLVLTAPDRLTRQLDVCAQIARSATIARIVMPPEPDHRAVAEQVLSHFASVR